ncbi:hypothetical protein [Pseudomonas koreensis]|uniref:Lipoprotein n=1 Tax=Pseudomonas koreensis TaxID=198620 RepID=A0A9X2XGX5_9PSED|nr:hypothetical protein [Pseudomonas koreensis]MCU7248770.1 hypothetical protein [Pseudomonas koreensis]
MSILKVYAVVLLVMLSGCSFKQDKPPANLQFSKIERVRKTVLYDLYFSSDVNILGPYKSLVGVRLICALGDDQDFSTGHRMKWFIKGSVSQDRSGTDLDFVSRITFSESDVNGSSERDLTAVELRELLEKKTEIPCRFLADATMMDTYYSNTMYVPVESIVRAVD